MNLFGKYLTGKVDDKNEKWTKEYLNRKTYELPLTSFPLNES